MLRKPVHYDVVKASDFPGPYQFITNASIQDEMVYDASSIIDTNMENKKEKIAENQQEACKRAFNPAITKIATNDTGACSIDRIIRYEPVVTPYLTFFNSFEGEEHPFVDLNIEELNPIQSN